MSPDFAWRAEAYEFVDDVPALDLLTGSPEARTLIESGQPLDDLFADWRSAVEDFESGLEGLLLYRD